MRYGCYPDSTNSLVAHRTGLAYAAYINVFFDYVRGSADETLVKFYWVIPMFVGIIPWLIIIIVVCTVHIPKTCLHMVATCCRGPVVGRLMLYARHRGWFRFMCSAAVGLGVAGRQVLVDRICGG